MSRSLVKTGVLVLVVSLSLPLAGVALGSGKVRGAAPDKVLAKVETVPVQHTGDAADDPALWVNPGNPALSLVIGNDKQGALEVYNLRGKLRQRITTADTFWGNVDVRQGVVVNGTRLDLIAAMNKGLRLFTVNGERRLVPVTAGDDSLPTGQAEGLCLYESHPSGRVFVFVIKRDGRVRQFRIDDPGANGTLTITQVRQFRVGSEAEGCVADDLTGALYVSEEAVGLWRYGAEPIDGAARRIVDRVGARGNLVRDVEGVTLVERGRNGQLIVSAQNKAHPLQSYFAVYQRRGNGYLGSFRIANGGRADGCSRTDGIQAYAGSLGPAFPQGIFICQDDRNTTPRPGLQNFKFTPLQRALPLS